MSNKEKHGINFEEAQSLWNDKMGVELIVRSSPEIRHVKIATFNKKHWTAVFTLREKRIRLISVRRSRKEERALYERNLKKNN